MIFSKLFLIPSDGGKFSNDKHKDNFIKYLFSRTGSHSETDKTKFNVIQYNNKILLNDKPTKHKKDFINWFDDNGYKTKNTQFDLTYVLFFIYLDNIIYTNFFERNGDDLYCLVDDEIAGLIEHYYSVKFQDLIPMIEQCFDASKTVYTLHEAPEHIRLKIDSKINAQIVALTGVEPIFTISHADQGLYHLHRIIER